LLIPKKSLGQNFLIDNNLCKKIVSNINIKEKIIIEIGPGTGQVTKEIIKIKPKKLILIEKDKKLFNLLKIKYKEYSFIEIYNEDALKFNYKINEKFNIISNLPYNISTKIILNFLIDGQNIIEMIFLVQKELANKFKYEKNNKSNKYNLFINLISKYKIIFNISNKVFYPKPKIQSSLIKICPLQKKINKHLLWTFNQNIFKNKRKKINSIFKNYINVDNKILNKRPENLNLIEYQDLFNIF